MRVGLTGGIGSGKSTVAERWRERGAVIVDADVIAREVVAPGTPGLQAIAAEWPKAIDAAGAVDRPALAQIVFRDAAALERLNAITHPRVRARANELEASAPPGALVVHVIPLLFESDYWRTCDATVVVVAPIEERIERVESRDGVRREDVERRMHAQIDPARARALATYTIENDRDLERLRERADAVFDRLLAGVAGS